MQPKRLQPTLLSLGLFLFLASGCGRTQTSDDTSIEPTARLEASRNNSETGSVEPHEAHTASPPAHGGSRFAIEDRLHRKVEFTKPPRRIVSLSPATTELLFALGLGDSIVGVTKHCNYPPAALDITRVGSGTLEGISREMILSVQPELILCKSDYHQPLVETFEKLNVPIFAVGPQSLEELFEEARWIGRICDREAAAAKLIDGMQSRLNLIREVVAARTADRREPKRVFYEVWDDPLMSAGAGSYIDELLQLAGLENIASQTTARYPRVSAEIVIRRDPEVILAPTTHFQKVDISIFNSRPGWSGVTAVREGQIFLIDGDQVSRCGPRVLDALEQIVASVYPDNPIKANAAAQSKAIVEEARAP